MKFQWYVINLDEATVEGTNDVDLIQSLVHDDTFILLTAQHGKFFNGSQEEIDVEELSEDNDDGDEDDDESEDGDDEESSSGEEYVPDADSDEDVADEDDDEPLEPIKSDIDDPENDKNW